MRNISKERFTATNVLIEFEDGPLSFRIRHGATLAEISEILDRIGTWHEGQPLSIDVRFKVPTRSDRTIARPLISSPIAELGRAPDYLPEQPDYATWLHRLG